MLDLFTWAQTRTTLALREEKGQGLTEYALILFFVAIVAILALTFLGTQITSVISSVASKV